MASISGITGEVTSWTGTGNANLFGTAAADAAFTLNISAPEIDTTAFGATTAEYGANLISWGGSFTSRIEAANIGVAGSVAWAGSFAYATTIRRWAITITADEIDITPFGTSSTFYRNFIFGLVRWSGVYEGFLDDTTAITRPALIHEATNAAAITLNMGDTNDHLTGDAFVTSIDPIVQPSEANQVTHAFRGTGDLASGSASSFFPVSTDPVIPVNGTLVLTASSGRTYTGTAFWTSIQIVCPTDGIVTATVNFRGSGTLTIA